MHGTISRDGGEDPVHDDGSASVRERVAASALPIVAVAYGPRCTPVMDIVEAATGICDLLWLVDLGLPEMAEMEALLRRYGVVVDVSGRDAGAIGRACAPHSPRGIVTYLDAGMVALANLADQLGLPFHRPDTAAALVDKALQREVLGGAGVEVPACVVVPSGPARSALADVPETLVWPAILKPRSAQGSRHTFLAHDLDHAWALLDALGDAREVMVLEEYLAGDPIRSSLPFADYLSVESIVSNGAVSHLALTGRFPLAENFRETGFFIPAAVDAGEQEQILELVTAAIAALGVTDGCLHTEVKFTSDGPRVIEVNGRLGGGVHEMLARAAGLSILELTLRVALGQEVRVDGPVLTRRTGFRLFLQPPAVSAVIRDIVGIDAITELPGVDAVSIHQPPGAGLDWRDGSRNHVLAVVGSARDHAELLEVDRLLRERVTVTYAEIAG